MGVRRLRRGGRRVTNHQAPITIDDIRREGSNLYERAVELARWLARELSPPARPGRPKKRLASIAQVRAAWQESIDDENEFGDKIEQGTQQQVAARLGVDDRTLRRYLHEWGLRWPPSAWPSER